MVRMLILIILTPKGFNVASFRTFWYIVRQDLFWVLTCTLGEEKKVTYTVQPVMSLSVRMMVGQV